MSKLESICGKIDEYEFPPTVVAILGSLAVDPVDIPVSELIDLQTGIGIDPIGAVVTGGSLTLIQMKVLCDRLEENSEETNSELSDFSKDDF